MCLTSIWIFIQIPYLYGILDLFITHITVNINYITLSMYLVLNGVEKLNVEFYTTKAATL